MVEIVLPLERQRAGTDYLAALRSLGLDPDALLWARYTDRPDWTLVLITGLCDAEGPLGLTRLLFEAHNASLLPGSIDPFDLDVCSPDQAAAGGLFDTIRDESGKPLKVWSEGAGRRTHRTEDVVVPGEGVYAWAPDRRMSPSERDRLWHRVTSRVHAQAA